MLMTVEAGSLIYQSMDQASINYLICTSVWISHGIMKTIGVVRIIESNTIIYAWQYVSGEPLCHVAVHATLVTIPNGAGILPFLPSPDKKERHLQRRIMWRRFSGGYVVQKLNSSECRVSIDKDFRKIVIRRGKTSPWTRHLYNV